VLEEDPVRNAARRARRRKRIPEGSACFFCGLTDPDILIAANRTLLEEHHVAGIDNVCDLTVFLCPNHHRQLHVGLLDAGLDFSRPVTRCLLEVVVCVLLGTSVLFAAAAATYSELAEQVRALIAAMDANCAEWRALPEAVI
jgi:hypothetical protein